jgi:5-methylcytosine-specific restriction protein A
MAKPYTRRWDMARKHYLRTHPLCVICQANGIVQAATVVDHIRPHGGDIALFWDEANWQSLCCSCHNSDAQRMEKSGTIQRIIDIMGVVIVDRPQTPQLSPNKKRDRGGSIKDLRWRAGSGAAPEK